MMMGDKKKEAGLAIILGQPGPSEEGASLEEEINAMEEGLSAAAEEMMVSFEARDAEGLKTALRSFIEMID